MQQRPKRILRHVCFLYVNFNFSVDRSYQEMQQYMAELHSKLNKQDEEMNDLVTQMKKMQSENRVLKEELEQTKVQLEESEKARKDLRNREEEALAGQKSAEEKYSRLAATISELEEDLGKISAESPLLRNLIHRRDGLKSENERLSTQSHDSRSVGTLCSFNCSQMFRLQLIPRRWNR